MTMTPFFLSRSLDNVREKVPLVHSITNYVTVNDCANALLACGASPIMSDEPDDVTDITSICDGLVINIGTLNSRSIEAMHVAGARAVQLGNPIVLDPVGAGASALRTKTASELFDELPVTVVRGNMSEVKALAGAASATRGVDVGADDMTTEENLVVSAEFVRDLAAKSGSIVAVTGAIDIVSDGRFSFAVRNGTPIMSKMTGAGCMLTCIAAAYVAANPENRTEAVVAAVANEGVAGQIAQSRMAKADGNGSFRTYLLDALFTMTGDMLERGARVEEL